MHKLIMILVLSGLQVLYGQVNQAEKLLQEYDRYALAPLDLKQMKHAFLLVQLQKIARLNKTLQLQAIGKSVEQRAIYKISFGQGHTRVLLWSQMHGDEPTATAALLAVFN
jgi:hypothetical protein